MRRVLGAVLALLAVACGGGSSPPVTVFAAASLTNALRDAGEQHVTYAFGGSNALVAQIEQGAPADVVATADTANMDKLVAAHLVDAPVVFARNKLEIAVQPGNPKRITGIDDLARAGVTVVLGAPGVPAGDYARGLLGSAVTPKSLETDVKSAVAKVAAHEADATVVYVTDVRAAGPTVTGVPVPDDRQPRIEYPIAVVRITRHRRAADAFVRSAVSGAVQRSLLRAGFLAPR